jgi:hypothetical protein
MWEMDRCGNEAFILILARDSHQDGMDVKKVSLKPDIWWKKILTAGILPVFRGSQFFSNEEVGQINKNWACFQLRPPYRLNDFYVSKQSVGDIKSPLHFIFIKSV